MGPADVLFVAGNVERLASIKIRCREIAMRLGCDCYYNAVDPNEVPGGYKAYFCVKPDFGPQGVEQLAKRGAVIWDILDDDPPSRNVTAYVASTSVAAQMVKHLGRTVVIPHYHCNLERIPASASHRRPAYIGSQHWYPEITGVEHDRHFVHRWQREQVADAFRSTGIALNLRYLGSNFGRFVDSAKSTTPEPGRHLRLNSGLKLINCLGFGLPSISAMEPAYLEIAPHCTIFCEMNSCASSIERLQQDHDLYEKMRRQCLDLAEKYHLDVVVLEYVSLIKSL